MIAWPGVGDGGHQTSEASSAVTHLTRLFELIFSSRPCGPESSRLQQRGAMALTTYAWEDELSRERLADACGAA